MQWPGWLPRDLSWWADFAQFTGLSICAVLAFVFRRVLWSGAKALWCRLHTAQLQPRESSNITGLAKEEQMVRQRSLDGASSTQLTVEVLKRQLEKVEEEYEKGKIDIGRMLQLKASIEEEILRLQSPNRKNKGST